MGRGAIVGVVSKNTGPSLKVYNGKSGTTNGSSSAWSCRHVPEVAVRVGRDSLAGAAAEAVGLMAAADVETMARGATTV